MFLYIDWSDLEAEPALKDQRLVQDAAILQMPDLS